MVVSDSALKQNIRPVNEQEILDKLAELPLRRWSYKTQDESIEHIGPMAQDFHRIFGLGEDERHINTLDPDGVALAAIKALHRQNVDLKARMAKMEALLEVLLAERDAASRSWAEEPMIGQLHPSSGEEVPE